MPTTAWKYAGTGSSISAGGTPWSNPGNVTASDNAYASVALDDENNPQSDVHRSRNFGFTSSDVPSGATITGIEVGVERKSDSGYDQTIRLSINSAGTTADQIGTNQSTGATWPTTESETFFGGSSSLFGASPTQAQVTSSAFGFDIAGAINGVSTLYIDAVRMRITYSAGTTYTKTIAVGLAGPAAALRVPAKRLTAAQSVGAVGRKGMSRTVTTATGAPAALARQAARTRTVAAIVTAATTVAAAAARTRSFAISAQAAAAAQTSAARQRLLSATAATAAFFASGAAKSKEIVLAVGGTAGFAKQTNRSRIVAASVASATRATYSAALGRVVQISVTSGAESARIANRSRTFVAAVGALAAVAPARAALRTFTVSISTRAAVLRRSALGRILAVAVAGSTRGLRALFRLPPASRRSTFADAATRDRSVFADSASRSSTFTDTAPRSSS